MYDFGSRLKSIRRKRGFTQKELALRINKSISAISSYESNAQLPPLDVLEDIARTLNTSLDYLVGIDKSNTFSAKALTPAQSDLLDLVFQEFNTKTTFTGELSQEQITLLQKLIEYFIKK